MAKINNGSTDLDRDYQKVLEIPFVKQLVKHALGDDVEIVDRGDSYSIAPKDEDERFVHRLILIPPRGFTANAPHLMNAHDEVEEAKIAHRGVIKPEKNGFSGVKDSLLFAALPNKGVSDEDTPYFTFDIEGDDNPDLVLERYSPNKHPFPVVKKDGYGFYHNLVNLTDDWMMLELNKVVRPMKEVDLGPYLADMKPKQAEAVQALHEAIVKEGDYVLKKDEYKDLVDTVASMPPSKSLPALAEMLYTRETGRHEACTAFGMILKIAKDKPNQTINFLEDALERDAVIPYYANQLIGKIEKKMAANAGNDADASYVDEYSNG